MSQLRTKQQLLFFLHKSSHILTFANCGVAQTQARERCFYAHEIELQVTDQDAIRLVSM